MRGRGRRAATVAASLAALAVALLVFTARPRSAPAGPASGDTATARRRPSSPAQPLRLPVQRFALKNGLNVLLHVDHRTPRVVVNVLYRVGSRHERAGRSGMAHLFEHLMFMGTKRIPEKQIDLLMEGAGGSNNAYTSEDVTNYYDKGPSRLLELLLWIEADRMATLASALTDKKLGLQRKVVLNERRQSYENAPYGKAQLALPKLAWPATHPYGHTVIGATRDLRAVTVADCRRFFGRFYSPRNAVLVIAGDVDPKRTRALVERYFGWIAAAKGKGAPSITTRPRPRPASLSGEVKRVMGDSVSLSRIIIGWHAPPAMGPGDAELDLVASMLGSGKLSRLYRELVYEKRVAVSVRASQQSHALGSLFTVVVTLQRGQKIEAVQAQVDALLRRFIAKPPSPAELARAKTKVQAAFVRRLQSLASRAESLARYFAFTGDPDYVAKDLARYMKASAETVHRQAKATLGAKGRVVIHVVPKKRGAGKGAGKGKASGAGAKK